MMEHQEFPGAPEVNSAEREAAADLGQKLEETAAVLNDSDPSRLSPEQIHRLKASADMIVGILAAYAGVKLVEFGMDVSGGMSSSDNPSALVALEHLGRAIGSMALALPGALVVLRGGSKFAEGLRRFMEKLPEVKPQR